KIEYDSMTNGHKHGRTSWPDSPRFPSSIGTRRSRLVLLAWRLSNLAQLVVAAVCVKLFDAIKAVVTSTIDTSAVAPHARCTIKVYLACAQMRSPTAAIERVVCKVSDIETIHPEQMLPCEHR